MARGPAVPRAAATVALVRDADSGPEVYLLRRVHAMAFAGGMTVFPGGSVDQADAHHDIPWEGPAPAEWAERLSADESLARALVCAAVRETFEECAVLLAGPRPDQVVSDVSSEDWEAERRALEAREQSLSELLTRRGLVLRADLLRAWAHWITPEAEPRRFDTRFFVAALPSGQMTKAVGGEADRAHWMRPRDAMAAVRRGELAMLPPTAVTLDEIAAYSSVAAILAAAEQRQIRPILPRLVVEGGNSRIVLPGEEGYHV